MKLSKIVLIILVLCGVSVLSLSCASESDSVAVTEDQVVTVQRGDLTVDITAVGNLLFSNEEELAFELSGTVGEVLVEIGDSVEEEQALVKLDISEWEEQIDALERSLTTAERKLATEKSDLIQAQINLQTAEYNLNVMEEVQEARDAIEDAEYDLKFAQAMLQHAIMSGSSWNVLNYWGGVVSFYEARLAQAQQELADILAGKQTVVTTEVATQVALKKLQVELAEMRLEEAQNAVVDAEQGIADAQEELDEAKATSPVIKAPFAGIIIGVNVEGGDEVLKGTVAVQLADPNKFEADILVSEMDILQVRLGGEAWVQVDAMPGMSLPAEVAHISPTATIQQGVVNYRVKVEIESLEAVMQERREARQEMTQGELPERIRQAIEEGRITQEQAEEMIKRIRQAIEEGGITQEQIEEMIKQRQQGQGRPQEMPTMLLEDFQLREGLTVTVSIIVNERNDVLLVPNSAITSRGGQAYVQVVSPDGTTEERLVTTGLSDWQYTEIIDGLSEGEKVVVTGTGTTTTTPTTPKPEGKLPFFPGKR